MHCRELLHGTKLRVPETFFKPWIHLPSDTADRASQLRAVINSVRQTPTCYCSPRSVSVTTNLASYTHVFVFTDPIRRSLQQPCHYNYDGFYRGTKKNTANLIKSHKAAAYITRSVRSEDVRKLFAVNNTCRLFLVAEITVDVIAGHALSTAKCHTHHV